MVYTEVTADNQTYEMWLPVMDAKNKAMREQPYTYQVYDSYKKTYIEKTVQAATMFDINKAIMRCLVKNLAMFGLGLYVYAGEDLSNEENLVAENNLQKKQTTRRTKITTPSNASLLSLYNQHRNEVEGNAEIKALFTERKNQLKAA